MNRLAKFVAPLLIGMIPGAVFALGLGEIHVRSKLNQALDAEIELLYSDPSEAQTTEVALASAEDFRRVGLDRAAISVPLAFEIAQDAAGRYLIRVTSTKPVADPFVDFLIEVNWSNGRLLREYVVLLDPPLTAPAEAVAVGEPPRAQPPQPAARPEPARAPASAAAQEGGSYQVRRGDTLWEIARDRRPSDDITINQMMMALYQTNPEAFFADNINALRAGAVLRLPDLDRLRGLPSAAALSQVRTQNQAWENYRQAAAGRTPTVSEAGVSPEFVRGEPRPGDDDESRLELVPAASQGDSDRGSRRAADVEVAALRSDLARSREELANAGQENAELQSRVRELESLISNLERAISLKDADLADLQNQAELARLSEPAEPPVEIGETADDAAEMLEAELGAVAGLAEDTSATPGDDTTPDGDVTPGGDPLDSAETSPEAGQAAQAPGGDVAMTTPPRASPGMVDRIMASVTNPLVLGGLGMVLVLGVGGLLWSRRRSEATSGESLVERMMAGGEAAEEAVEEAVEEPVEDEGVVAGGADDAELVAAVDADPQNAQAHLALLRSYYATDRADEFAQAAQRMLADIGGESHPAWMEVKAMGANLAPNAPLFATAGEAPAAEPEFGGDDAETVVSAEALDLSEELDLGDASPAEEDDFSLDFELDPEDLPGSQDEAPEVDAAAELADDDLSLDFDLEPADLPAEADESELAIVSGEQALDLAGDEAGDDDLSLDFDLGEPLPEAADTEDWEDDDLPDLNLEDLDIGEPAEVAEEPAAAVEVDTEFDLPAVTAAADEVDAGLDLDLDLDSAAESATEEQAVDPEQVIKESETLAELESSDEDVGLDDLSLDDKALFGDDDAVGTKLDLAKAYIDMGDPEGARGMLEEVRAEGNPAQQEEAEDLLGRLAP